MAHDPENQCQEGDVVTIEETRPISKNKTWKLSSIDKKALQI
jgi:small subunit ribosomal protein S17